MGAMRRWASLGASGVVLVLLRGTAHAAIAVAPDAVSATPGERIAFVPSGGSGTYRWSLGEAPSGGAIDANGSYVAGPYADVDDVVVLADIAGNTTKATVHVTTTPVVATDGGSPKFTPSPGINLAGGADADNCSVRGVGAPASEFGAAGLALALAFALARRRHG